MANLPQNCFCVFLCYHAIRSIIVIAQGGERAAQNNTVVFAGGVELGTYIQAFESAGCMVISAHTLDYALAANELFAPRALVLDADEAEGDIDLWGGDR